MKSFNEFLSDDGTYVSIGLTEESNNVLYDLALSLGLRPIENFHVTVVYSQFPINIPYGTFPLKGSAKVTGIKYLGELNSEYRAIVLELESDEIQSLHDKFKREYGYVHTYPEFIQHVSVAYKPTEELNLSNIQLPTSININSYTITELNT